jgi:hypothetical protein
MNARVRLEGVLLERLNTLDRKKGMPSVFEPLARYEGDSSSSTGTAGREICWPALSNPGSDERCVERLLLARGCG